MCQINAHEQTALFPTPCPALTDILLSPRAHARKNSLCHSSSRNPAYFKTNKSSTNAIGRSRYVSTITLHTSFVDTTRFANNPSAPLRAGPAGPEDTSPAVPRTSSPSPPRSTLGSWTTAVPLPGCAPDTSCIPREVVEPAVPCTSPAVEW